MVFYCMNNIDNLLKDIFVRHACKNLDKHVVDVEKAIGIKLVPVDGNNFEFTWSKDFDWFVDLKNAKCTILKNFKLLDPKLFRIIDISSTIDYKMSCYRLVFIFKFYPENAI